MSVPALNTELASILGAMAFASVVESGAEDGTFGTNFKFQFTAIPEPTTFAALSGLLGMGLIGRWWRRRKAA